MTCSEIRKAPVPVLWAWGTDGYVATPCISGDPWWWRHIQNKRGVSDLLVAPFDSLSALLDNGQTVIVRAKPERPA